VKNLGEKDIKKKFGGVLQTNMALTASSASNGTLFGA